MVVACCEGWGFRNALALRLATMGGCEMACVRWGCIPCREARTRSDSTVKLINVGQAAWLHNTIGAGAGERHADRCTGRSPGFLSSMVLPPGRGGLRWRYALLRISDVAPIVQDEGLNDLPLHRVNLLQQRHGLRTTRFARRLRTVRCRASQRRTLCNSTWWRREEATGHSLANAFVLHRESWDPQS